MKVSFKEGDCVPHTVWELNNRLVMHCLPGPGWKEAFVCVWLGGDGKVKGEVEKDTTSLQEALDWLQSQ